jgi:multiple sugar transport system substrate-binding protein
MTALQLTRRALFGALLVVCLAVTPLFAGGSQEQADDDGNGHAQTEEPVTISYANFSAAGGNEDKLAEMVETFEAQNPGVRVDVETIGFNDYFTQLQTRVAAGTAPDAFELNFENFVSYAEKGLLRDISPLEEATDFDASALNDRAYEAFATGGTQYGLPASFSTVLLFYNADLFDQAGLSYPDESWTWDDMDSAAADIAALGDNHFGIFQPIHFFEFFKTVGQNGGSLLNEDKSAFTLTQEANVETLEHMVARVQETNVMPTSAQMSGMGDWDLFKSGRLGMLVTGIWAFPDFAENIDFSWDVAVEPGNTQKATHFFANGLVISADAGDEKAEAAFKWIQFMSASREAAEIRVNAGWELPASEYEDVLETYTAETPPENRQAVFESLNYLITPPVIEDFSRMSDIVSQELEAARNGSKSPEQALSDAQSLLESQIDL